MALLKKDSTKTTLSLRWDPPRDNGNNIDGYEIALCPDAQTHHVEADAVDFTFEELEAGTGYSISLKAHNASGWGPYTQIVAYTGSDIPSRCTRIQVVETKPRTLHVKWEKPPCHGAKVVRYVRGFDQHITPHSLDSDTNFNANRRDKSGFPFVATYVNPVLNFPTPANVRCCLALHIAFACEP